MNRATILARRDSFYPPAIHRQSNPNTEVQMHRNRYVSLSHKFAGTWLTRILFCFVTLMTLHSANIAQEIQRTQPIWWFGVAAGGNLNFYGGTTHMLNASTTTPRIFQNGIGAGPFLGPLVEYRPNPIWGGILQVLYDDRGGSFYDITNPNTGGKMTLSTSIRYVSIEPSIRYAPHADGWYAFAGPRVAFNWSPNLGTNPLRDEKTFTYTDQGGIDGSKAEFSDLKAQVWSINFGVGYDFELLTRNDKNQIELSPFISFQPAWGDGPRSKESESWDVATVRLGAAIKFGSGSVIPQGKPAAVEAVVERDVQFSVRAPKAVPIKRRVRESFPIRNYVFFDEGSSELPGRYVTLTKDQAVSFNESQLQEVRPINSTGRSLRQMTVYYNILNIVGDRLKRNPGTAISVTGASEKNQSLSNARAETIKKYLVDVFGVDGSRITTEGKDKPGIPSVVPDASKELGLLQAEDRRVDIESTSPEMMIQVGGGRHYMLRPVEIVAVVEDPLDSHVLFHVEGAKEVLASWSLEISDEQGRVQRYGPYTRDDESISGNAILGDRSQGDYRVVMLAQTKGGKSINKERSLHLIRRVDQPKEAVRYSILFDFDRSQTVDSYESFLTNTVTPLIPDNGMVIIHGHTDIVGDEVYNDSLSNRRAQDAQGILQSAIAKSGKHGITFETFGMGENTEYAPFDNYFPEERFYNRTVIIDIVPD